MGKTIRIFLNKETNLPFKYQAFKISNWFTHHAISRNLWPEQSEHVRSKIKCALFSGWWKYIYINLYVIKCTQGSHDHMVVGFTTTFAISAYHYSNCEFESRSGEVYSIQHYVIKFVSDLWQVSGFLQVLVSSTNKIGHVIWNIVEVGVKHHSPNP